MIARRAAHLLLALSLMVAWTTGGWAAACAQPAAPATQPHAMAGHAMPGHAMHGGMHHHPRPAPDGPAPERRAPRAEMPECPLMAMNGGSCVGAAQVPALAAAPAAMPAGDAPYLPADAIRDRLLPLAHFRPPEA